MWALGAVGRHGLVGKKKLALDPHRLSITCSIRLRAPSAWLTGREAKD